MAEREVRWTKTATHQRRHIFQYWVQKTGSSDYSVKLLKLSSQRIEHIRSHPFFGQEADFPDTRVVSLGHYSIFYKFISDKIYITAFWDNRQDPKKLFNLLSKH